MVQLTEEEQAILKRAETNISANQNIKELEKIISKRTENNITIFLKKKYTCDKIII